MALGGAVAAGAGAAPCPPPRLAGRTVRPAHFKIRRLH